MFKIFKKRPGFGLLEAVIASGVIVVLSSVAVGVSHVVITNSNDFDAKIVASDLAQSGIEAAYTIRDKNLNDGDPDTAWDDGFVHTQASSNPSELLNCDEFPQIFPAIAVLKNSLGRSCQLSVNDKTWMDNSSTDIHYLNAGVNPQILRYNNKAFYRDIFIKPDPNNANIVEIRSIVFVDSEDPGKVVVMSDISAQLTNWKDTDTSDRSTI